MHSDFGKCAHPSSLIPSSPAPLRGLHASALGPAVANHVVPQKERPSGNACFCFFLDFLFSNQLISISLYFSFLLVPGSDSSPWFVCFRVSMQLLIDGSLLLGTAGHSAVTLSARDVHSIAQQGQRVSYIGC